MTAARRLAPQVIFGLGDGAMSILGVVLYAAGHRAWVLPLALSGGLSAAVSMAGNEWLSDDDNGLAGVVAMFAATLGGSVLPALPYAVLPGLAAPAVSGGCLLTVALVIGRLRALRAMRHPYLATVAVLAGCIAVSVLCAALIPASGPA